VLESGTEEQMGANVEKIVKWVEEWKRVREGLREDEEMDVVPFAEAEVVEADEEDDEEEEDDGSSDDDEEEDDGDDAKA